MKKTVTFLFTIIYIISSNINIVSADSIPSWKTAYKTYLHTVINEMDSVNFFLYDVDNNGLPELVYNKNYNKITIASYIDNKVVEFFVNDFYDINEQFYEGYYYPSTLSENCFFLVARDFDENVRPFYEIYKVKYRDGDYQKSLAGSFLIDMMSGLSLGFFYPTVPKIEYTIANKEVTGEQFFTSIPIGAKVKQESKVKGEAVYLDSYIDNYEINQTYEIEKYPQPSSPDISYYTYTVPGKEDIGATFSMVTYPLGVYDVEYNINENPIFLLINGNYIMKPEIIKINNIPYLPLRLISEKTGRIVQYSNQIINVKGDKLAVELKINSDTVLYNGTEHKLDSVVNLINGKTYVPLNFAMNFLNAEVEYIENNDHKDGFFYPDIIVIENIYPEDIKKLSLEEAKKTILFEYKRPFYNNYSFYGTGFDLDSLTYVSNFGRYYVFKISIAGSTKEILVNRYTGETFYNYSYRGYL